MINYNESIAGTWKKDIWELIDAKKYQEGLRYLESLNFKMLKRKERTDYLVARSRILEGLFQFNEALEELNKIRDIAFVYVTKARLLSKMERFEDAMNVIYNIVKWQYNENAVLELASIFSAQGKHLEAVNLIKKYILNLENNVKATKNVAIYYNTCWAHSQAIKTIENFTNWKEHEDLVCAMAISLQKIGEYEKAIACITSYAEYEKENKCLVCLSRIHSELRNFDDAKKCLDKIRNKTSKAYLLPLGILYKIQGNYKEAIEVLTKIEKDPEAALIIAKIHHLEKEYEKSVQLLESLENYSLDKEIMRTLAISKQNILPKKEAIKLWKETTDAFPNYTKAQRYRLLFLKEIGFKPAYYDFADLFGRVCAKYPFDMPLSLEYCQYLTSISHPDALHVIDKTINSYPNVYKLYIMKSRFLKGNVNLAMTFLEKASIQFFRNAEIKLELLKLYLENDEKKFTFCKQECDKIFSVYGKLLPTYEKGINKLIAGKSFYTSGIPLWDLQKDEFFKKDYPSWIVDFFDKFPFEKTFVTGGSVAQLFFKNNLDLDNDLDVVCFEPDLKSKFIEAGAVTSHFFPNLLQITITGERKVDIWFPKESNLIDDNRSRDFCAFSLFGDKIGNIFSPGGGKGIEDAQSKILSMNGISRIRLDQDPTIFLRAIKLKIKYGFTFDLEFNTAFEEFNIASKLKEDKHLQERIFYIIKSHLDALEKKEKQHAYHYELLTRQYFIDCLNFEKNSVYAKNFKASINAFISNKFNRSYNLFYKGIIAFMEESLKEEVIEEESLIEEVLPIEKIELGFNHIKIEPEAENTHLYKIMTQLDKMKNAYEGINIEEFKATLKVIKGILLNTHQKCPIAKEKLTAITNWWKAEVKTAIYEKGWFAHLLNPFGSNSYGIQPSFTWESRYTAFIDSFSEKKCNNLGKKLK